MRLKNIDLEIGFELELLKKHWIRNCVWIRIVFKQKPRIIMCFKLELCFKAKHIELENGFWNRNVFKWKHWIRNGFALEVFFDENIELEFVLN